MKRRRRSKLERELFPVHNSYTSGLPSQRPVESSSTRPRQPTASDSTNGQRFTLRLATATDFNAVLQIQRTYSNQLGFLTATAILTAIEQSRAFIACLGSTAIGYAIFRLSSRNSPGTATIYHLAIARPHRRHGYGQRLHQRLLTHCRDRGSTVIQAWTRHDVDGHGFFATLNYVPILSKLPHNARRQPITLWRRLLHPNGSSTLTTPPSFSGAVHRRHSCSP